MSDAINLSKGQRINLAKEAPSLKRLKVTLGWKANRTDSGTDFDLDGSVFLCKVVDDNPQLLSNKHFLFYGEHVSPCGAVVHSGDDKTGGQGETIDIDLTKIAPNIDELSFVVTIHDGQERKQHFGMVTGARITLTDAETDKVIATYNLGDDFDGLTGVHFGSVYKRDDGAWAFKAAGVGYQIGLAGFVEGYGGSVA